MPDIYEMEWAEDVEKILLEMRQKIAKAGFGITLTGNRCTIRWGRDNELVEVHMIIESVLTPQESAKISAEASKWRAFCEKYPELADQVAEFMDNETNER